MPKSQYRSKRRKSVPESRTRSLVAAVNDLAKHPSQKPISTLKNRIYITETDRVIYVYEKTGGNISKIVDVSYETSIDWSWYTVIRYDSEHGQMHRHDYILDYNKPFVTTLGVRKRGTPDKWLTWAIEDVENNYIRYRTSFLKNNKTKLTTRPTMG